MHLDVDDSDVADMGACVYTMHADRGDIEDGYRRTQQTPKSSYKTTETAKLCLGKVCSGFAGGVCKPRIILAHRLWVVQSVR